MLMKKIYTIGFLLALFAVSGCAGLSKWTQLTQKVYQEKGRGFSAELPADWMRYNWGEYFFMTKDGMALNSVAAGRIKFNKGLENTKKVFSEGMTPQEIAEVEIDNLRSSPQSDKFQVISNQPRVIDGWPGFEIEYVYTVTESGLKVRGVHCGLIEKDWIYRIRYEAAEGFYFKRTQNNFDRFLETFKVI